MTEPTHRRSDRAASRKLDSLAAALADLLAAQLDGGDRDTLERRIAELRATIQVEEEI